MWLIQIAAWLQQVPQVPAPTGGGVSLDNALLIGLGTIIGGLVQALIGLLREHRALRRQERSDERAAIANALETLLHGLEAEVKRLGERLTECETARVAGAAHIERLYEQMGDLRQRLKVMEHWPKFKRREGGDLPPWEAE